MDAVESRKFELALKDTEGLDDKMDLLTVREAEAEVETAAVERPPMTLLELCNKVAEPDDGVPRFVADVLLNDAGDDCNTAEGDVEPEMDDATELELTLEETARFEEA